MSTSHPSPSHSYVDSVLRIAFTDSTYLMMISKSSSFVSHIRSTQHQSWDEDTANSTVIAYFITRERTLHITWIEHSCGQTKTAQLPWIKHQARYVLSFISGESCSSQFGVTNTDCYSSLCSYRLICTSNLYNKVTVTNARTNKLISSQSLPRCLTFSAVVPLLNSNSSRSR